MNPPLEQRKGQKSQSQRSARHGAYLEQQRRRRHAAPGLLWHQPALRKQRPSNSHRWQPAAPKAKTWNQSSYTSPCRCKMGGAEAQTLAATPDPHTSWTARQQQAASPPPWFHFCFPARQRGNPFIALPNRPMSKEMSSLSINDLANAHGGSLVGATQ